jgi:hypothetical protein
LVALLALAAGCHNNDLHALQTQGVLGVPTPATFSANVLYVDASVDGVAGGRLLIDSGAPLTILDPARFLPAKIDNGSGTVDSLTVGGLTVEDVPELGLALFGERPGFVPAGILGANVACQFATVLDYRGAEARLAAGPPTDVTDAALPGTRVPVALQGGGSGTLDGTQFSFPATRISLTVDIEGKQRTLILDTGSSYMVLRDALWYDLASDARPTLAGVPILSASGPVTGKLTRAKTVTLAGETVMSPPVLDIGDDLLDGFQTEVGHPVDGLLGGAFLREFLVTIDYPHDGLFLARYSSEDHIDPDEFHQVGIALDATPANSGHAFRVAAVFPNTDAAKVGILPGMVLVSVDGKMLDTLGLDEAEKLLHGPVGTVHDVETTSGGFSVKVDDLLPLP